MNQLPENSLRIYDITLVTSYLIGLEVSTQVHEIKTALYILVQTNTFNRSTYIVFSFLALPNQK